MPRFDTSFNFGQNAASARPAGKPAARPKSPAAKRPKAGKSKSRQYFGTMHGS